MTTQTRQTHRDLRERGQIVVIFALSIIVFVGLAAVVIDVSWYWANTLRMQRAADAAALAGVVYLPGNPTLAYLHGPRRGGQERLHRRGRRRRRDPGPGSAGLAPPAGQRHRPGQHVLRPVLGLTSLNARRDSKADFVLPVPMGSPQNYYGVSALKGSTTTSVTNTVVTNHFDNTRNSGLDVATTAPAGTPWVTSPGGTLVRRRRLDQRQRYAQTKTNAATQQFGGFRA